VHTRKLITSAIQVQATFFWIEAQRDLAFDHPCVL
jgi:hypothetical protein